jgi:hypothetical protein
MNAALGHRVDVKERVPNTRLLRSAAQQWSSFATVRGRRRSAASLEGLASDCTDVQVPQW